MRKKGKEKKKQRGEGKEEQKKKAMVTLLVFIMATLAEKTVGRKRSVLAVTVFLNVYKIYIAPTLHKKNERIHLTSQIKWLKTEYIFIKLTNIREINYLRFRDYKKGRLS